ncbi:MAG: HigA family addiction module antitoxin [Gammaproteobacteria bacterium]|jgi:addiction module HigA family antidote
MAWHHPGKILYEQFLQPRNLSQNRLARVIEVPPRRINEIVLGKRAITADTAVRLGRYFNNEPAYWMKLQTDYDIALAINNIGIHLYAIEPPETSQAETGGNGRFQVEPCPPARTKRSSNIRRRLLR